MVASERSRLEPIVKLPKRPLFLLHSLFTPDTGFSVDLLLAVSWGGKKAEQ
jgi:hypothetical protein